jgi:uncharacterized protein (DUF952 family)
MTGRVYKILTATDWAQFEREGLFEGSADDRRDGYIHFSTEAQVERTLAKHFRDASEPLVCAEVEARLLGEDLRWDMNARGEVYPHLYAALPLAAVVDVRPIEPARVSV